MPRTALLECVGAPHLAAGGLDPGEGGRLLVAELLGLLEQRPPGVLEALGGVLVTEGAQFVPVAAADLVQRLVGQLHNVIGIDADGRLRGVLAHRLGVAAGHVHRHRAQPGGAREDRGLELARPPAAMRHGSRGRPGPLARDRTGP